MSSRPWEEPALNPDLVAFGALTASEQDEVTGAVQNAISLVAGPDPDRATELQRVAMRAATHTLKNKSTGELFIAVEAPRLDRDFDMSKLPPVDYSIFVGTPFYKSIAVRHCNMKDELMLASVRQPVPLIEALQLLTSESSPTRELARRREEITGRIERERQAAADDLARRSESDRQQAMWFQRNREKLARWERASRLAQILAVSAQDFPALRDFASLVIELEATKGVLRMPKWMERDEADTLPA